MPRPAIKRHRQNSFKKSSPRRQPDTNAHREYLKKKLADVQVGRRPENSDDSDGIVTTRASGRNRKGPEIYASGAVAKGDKAGSFPTKTQRTRTLRENTEEILSQRSRSSSRAASVVSNQSVNAKPAKEKEKENSGAKDSSSNKRQKTTKADTRLNGIATNIQGETSVLGTIKPRKRQNSILETMGIGRNDLGPDSSAIHSDDEERFMPDDISTPAPVSTNGLRSDATKTTSSLKRKRGAEVPSQPAATDGPSSPLSSVRSPQLSSDKAVPEIPRPTRSQQRKLSTTKRSSKLFEDIMAPPESSDSEDDSHEPALQPEQSPKIRRQAPVAPSTQQLRSLMPSKQDRSISGFQPSNEFEMQEGTTTDSDDTDENEQEHSSFTPMRTRRGQAKTTPLPKEKTKVKRKKAPTKEPKTKGQDKAASKSTRNTSFTPSPVRLRTPLPLSSSRVRGSEAKSPSKQGTIMRDRSTNTPLAGKSSRATRKRYGGSRLRETGKENQPISLSDEGSGSDSGLVDKDKLKVAREQANGPETQAWKKKWADIDEYQLEFEEVSIPTRSSSPTGMSR